MPCKWDQMASLGDREGSMVALAAPGFSWYRSVDWEPGAKSQQLGKVAGGGQLGIFSELEERIWRLHSRKPVGGAES